MYKYIVIEGADWSGKTFLAKKLFDILPENKVFTKEPGTPGLDFCMGIRKVILNTPDLSPTTYTLLFSADREEHLNKVVEPALKKNKWVVSDRSILSDYAYRPQRELNIYRDKHFLRFIALKPLVLYIITNSDNSLERVKNRDKNPFELTHVIHKLDIIKQNYQLALERFKEHGGSVATIDNNGTIRESMERIIYFIEDCLTTNLY